MSWTALPSEIQFQIAGHLNRDDSKNFRLTSKSNAAIVSPRLFRTIHLTPNTRSFDRARQVAKATHLVDHVRALVYHVGVLEDVHNGFPFFRDDIIRLHQPSGSYDDIMKDVLWKYNCFLEEMDGQRDFETRDEHEELAFLCKNFSAVESLTTVLDEDDPFSPPEDFIGSRTGVHCPCSADGPHFSSLVNAARGKSLTSIRGWSASWRCLSRIVENSLQSIDMTNMRELSLNLFNYEILEMEAEHQILALQALDDILEASISSESYTLQLDFDEIPYEATSEELRPIAEVVFKHHWPALRKLALEGIAATEDSIVHFLEKHSTTLQSLHLDDIEILDEVSYDLDGNEISRRPGSVVVLFRRVRDALSDLKSLTLGGNFTNRRDESWYVNLEHDDEDNCLRRDIELWLLRKAPSPFPDELVHSAGAMTMTMTNGLGQDEDEDEDTDEDEALPEMSRASMAAECSDGSWVWDVDLLTQSPSPPDRLFSRIVRIRPPQINGNDSL